MLLQHFICIRTKFTRKSVQNTGWLRIVEWRQFIASTQLYMFRLCIHLYSACLLSADSFQSFIDSHIVSNPPPSLTLTTITIFWHVEMSSNAICLISTYSGYYVLARSVFFFSLLQSVYLGHFDDRVEWKSANVKSQRSGKFRIWSIQNEYECGVHLAYGRMNLKTLRAPQVYFDGQHWCGGQADGVLFRISTTTQPPLPLPLSREFRLNLDTNTGMDQKADTFNSML